VAGVRPRLMGVLETVLYYRTEQEEAVEHFYRDVLGLRPLGRFSWMMAFRAGGDVYLMCNADQYAEQTETPLHGASGPVHTAFLAPADEYERWRGHLAEQGVPLIEEITRDTGRSVYFRDPAGNLLEIMDADPWPS
jgi:catechol-2,3-dioxygenase